MIRAHRSDRDRRAADLPERLSEALVLALQGGLCPGHRRCGIGLKVRSFTGSAGSDAGVRLINTETPTGMCARIAVLRSVNF